MRVRPVVAADGKAPVRRASRVRGAYRTLIALDVGRGTELAVRPDGEHGHGTPLVVGYEHVLAGGVDAQVGRAGPFRADGVEQRQMSGRAIDRERAHRAGVPTTESGGFVCRVQMCSGGIEGEPGRVRSIRKDLALGERPG